MIKYNWQPTFINQSLLFNSLTPAYANAWQNQEQWPTIADYNQRLLAHRKTILTHAGHPLKFIPQTGKSQDFAEGYEPRIYLRGEALTRAENWHDFFNMLVWLTFPRIKAMLNFWQYTFLKQRLHARTSRTPIENILTHLDENGVIVISANPELMRLLKEQHWQALFWSRREQVKTQMHFFIVGHALYEKALRPYIGMTGSAIILEATHDFSHKPLPAQLTEVDALVSNYLADENKLAALTKLTPAPILGIPDWWPANETLAFYENKAYFREKSKE